jgi:2-alkyl-3-oxoalkanoate reductase
MRVWRLKQMNIFLAGATGVVGKRLIPLLLQAGHRVTGTTRTPAKMSVLWEMGAEPVLVDALDQTAVRDAVVSAKPDVVVHQLTDLSHMANLRRFDEELSATNRLRTQGTDFLLAAAKASGAKRFIAQSYSGWPNSRQGGPVKTEADPLDPNPPKSMSKTLAAIQRLENTVSGASDIDGLVLRYGAFYGPGTAISPGGTIFEAVRSRRFPIIGGGTGVWSFIHVEDVAHATLLAIQGGPSGVYNIVDDEPAPVSEWLPELAAAIGVARPFHLPAWIGQLLIGEAGLSMMRDVRGSANGKAKRLLNWQPKYATWREGFLQEFATHRQRRDQTAPLPAGTHPFKTAN